MCEARRELGRTHAPCLAVTSPAVLSGSSAAGHSPCPDPVLLTPPESDVSGCPEWQIQCHICVHKIFNFKK